MEVFVSLSITSNQMTADEIGAQLEMQCDKCWKVGDFRGKTKIKEKANGWKIEHHAESVDDVQPTLESLLNRVSGKENRLVELARSCEVLVRCAVYSKGAPPLFFDNHILEIITRIKAALDIDLYLV